MTVDGVATRDAQFLFISLTPRRQHWRGNGQRARTAWKLRQQDLPVARNWRSVDYVRSPTLQGETTFAKLWKASPVHTWRAASPQTTSTPRIAIPSAHSTSSPPRRRPLLNPSPQRTNERTTIAYGTAPEVPCGQRLSNRRPRQSLKLRARNASPFTVRPCPAPAKVDTRPPCGWTSRCVFWLQTPPYHYVTPWGPDATRAHQLRLVLFPSEPLRAQWWLQPPATLGDPPSLTLARLITC